MRVERGVDRLVAALGLGTWLAVVLVAAGATFLACGGQPAHDDKVAKISSAVTSSCSFTVTENKYVGSEWWGTITFRNNGPSTASNYVVELDLPPGVHCTAESESVPQNATLSPLTTTGSPRRTLDNHCVFTFSNVSLASGSSKTFNYSTDSQSFSAANTVTVTSPTCGGGGGGGGSASGLTCNTFTLMENKYDGPNWWGTVKFRNEGPSTTSSYVVEFDVPSGKHCTGESVSVPVGATLSPLTFPPNLAPQTASNHCVFTWTSGTVLLPGDSKTFNYSADSQSISSASNLVIRDAACAGPGAGGTGPDTRGRGSIVSTGTDVGTLPGEVSVNPRGSPSYTIPLWTPAGRNGMRPALALVYGSPQDDPAGRFWSVAGARSMVHRCNLSSLRIGRPNPIQFVANDNYCLDGKPLVLVNGSHGAFGAVYRTEPDSLTEVVVTASPTGFPTQVVVRTPDGLSHRYGGSPNLELTGSVVRWTVSTNGSRDDIGVTRTDAPFTFGLLRGTSEDVFHNKIWFKYTHPPDRGDPEGAQEPLIDTIEYVNTGADCDAGPTPTTCSRLIKFNYVDRPGALHTTANVAGMAFASTQALKSIDMQVAPPGTQTRSSVRFYRLTHEPSVVSKGQRLKQIEECDGNPGTVTGRVAQCKRPTVFTYFSEVPTLTGAPAVAKKNIAQPGDENFWGLQVADMNHDGRDDLVYRARPEGATSAQSPRWYARLSTGTSFTDPIDLKLLDGENFQFGDAVVADFIGGDSLPDIAVPVVGMSPTEKAFAFYQNKGFVGTAATFVLADKESTGPNQALEVHDFHGKGTLSLLRPTASGKWAYRFFRNTPNGPVLTGPSDPLNVTWPADFAQAGWSARGVDIDSDGAVEFLVPQAGSDRLAVLRQKKLPPGAPTSSDWEMDGAASTLLVSTQADPVAHFLLDHNGDGLPDALRLRRGQAVPNLIMNSGAGMEMGIPAPISQCTCDCDCTLSTEPKANVKVGATMKATDLVDPGVRILDFDVDGRDDVMLVDDGAIRDGASMPGASTVRTNLTVLLSRPDGFEYRDLGQPIGEFAEGPIHSTSPNVHNYRNTQILDANGDHLPDVVSVVGGTVRLLMATTTKPAKSDALMEITDGMGKKTALEYALFSDATVVTPGVDISLLCAPPYECPKEGPGVVSGVKLDNGKGGDQNEYRYHYNHYVVDNEGGGALGFNSWSVTDVSTNTTVTEVFDFLTKEPVKTLIPSGTTIVDVYSKIGLPVQRFIKTVDAANGFERLRTETYDHKFILTQTGWSYFTRPSHLTVKETETRGTSTITLLDTTTDYLVDPAQEEFAPAPSELTRVFDSKGTYTRTLVRTHTEFPGLWPRFRETNRTDARLTPGGNATTETDFTVNPQRGVIDKITYQPSDPTSDEFLEITFDRTIVPGMDDPHGLVRQTIRRSSSGPSRVDKVSYDPQSVHVTGGSNALVHASSIEVDPGLGVALAVTDANNTRSTFDYDGFGRLRRANPAGGGGRSISYARELESGQPAGSNRFVTKVVTTDDGGGQTRSTINRLGQQIQSETKNLDGTFSFVAKRYNPLGLLEGSTRPAQLLSGGSTPGLETTWEYDSLGRMRERVRPDDGRSRTDATVSSAASGNTYANFVTTVTDEFDRQTEYTRDMLGQVVTTKAFKSPNPAGLPPPPNRPAVPTAYTYGPFGVLKLVERKNETASQTLTTVLEYDVLGRRKKLTDPDTGIRQTFYNGFGEVRQEIDGNQDTTTFIRDDLGRVTEKHDKDGVTFFTWDTHGKGLLASSKSPLSLGEVEKEFFYDSSGRMFRAVTKIGGEAFQLDHAFDALGRVRTTSYPVGGGGTRFAVRNTYDSDSGELSKVQNNSDTSQTYWELKATKLDGQIKQEAFGGNVLTTDYDYSDVTGRLSGLKSTRANATTPFRSWAYDYWTDGNLRRRSDVTRGEHERFQYDELGRIEEWLAAQGDGSLKTGGWSVNYHVDDFGNLDQRNLVAGPATGGTDQPAAFTFFPGTNRVKTSPWGNYLYDNNGNQVARPGEGIAYTAFDLPKSIVATSSVTFQYDAGGTRAAKKKSATDYTYYVGGLYEKRVAGSLKEHIFYVIGGSGVVAQVRRTEGGGETKNYLLSDRLGSVDAVTKADGTPEAGEGTKRDPYGNAVPVFNEPRLPDFSGSGTQKVRLGFTGHEQDDELGYINMKGRMFDPRLGRFLTTDPIVQAPLVGQSYNRYAYTFNNPARYVDPSGFVSVCENGLRYVQTAEGDWQYSGHCMVNGTYVAGSGDGVGISVVAERNPPPFQGDTGLPGTVVTTTTRRGGGGSAAGGTTAPPPKPPTTKPAENCAVPCPKAAGDGGPYDWSNWKYEPYYEPLSGVEMTMENARLGNQVAAVSLGIYTAAAGGGLIVARLGYWGVRAAPLATGAGGVALSQAERLRIFYERLQAAPVARTAQEAVGLLTRTLDKVEDAYSGVAKVAEPGLAYAGRMYGPMADFMRSMANGSIEAMTKGQRIIFGANGAIEIISRATNEVIFKKCGGGG